MPPRNPPTPRNTLLERSRAALTPRVPYGTLSTCASTGTEGLAKHDVEPNLPSATQGRIREHWVSSETKGHDPDPTLQSRTAHGANRAAPSVLHESLPWPCLA